MLPVAAWYIGRTTQCRARKTTSKGKNNSDVVMYLRRDVAITKPDRPFPSVLSADGLTFKPNNELLVLVRDTDVRLTPQADMLWVDYLGILKATQFPMLSQPEALGQLLERSKSR